MELFKLWVLRVNFALYKERSAEVGEAVFYFVAEQQ
jgi:hypothetical protein